MIYEEYKEACPLCEGYGSWYKETGQVCSISWASYWPDYATICLICNGAGFFSVSEWKKSILI
jgi:hypothetical protein